MAGSFLKNELLFFSLWLIISSLYYLENLFSGDVLGGREVSYFSLIFKYLICLFFSIYAFRNNPLYALAAFLILFTGVAIFQNSSSANADYVVVMMVILTCFFGMPAFFSRYLIGHEPVIFRVLIFSGFLVSLLSIYQYFFLQDLYSVYWRNIGSVRLNSSLLNPNNMGVFVAACCLLLALSGERTYVKLLLLPFFMFSIVMSGSRTALLAFLIVFIFSKISNFRTTTYLRSIVFILCFLAVFMSTLFFYSNPFSDVRAFDFSSDGGRLNMQASFVMGFDLSYFYPDLYSERYLLIQENSYLMLLNSLGVVGVLCFLFLFVVFYKFEVQETKFKYLLMYYIIVLALSNFLNAYPNNLLFFLSLGSFFAPRLLYSGSIR
ncbi:O-antigen ligase family protein [Stutzerimonas nitrititolerans]|uniref:O-antigen ligase family protein n=1 Tax=Stutzerimonas nitrititolerans TaxID=2482751 RepID=UPI0028A9D34B|nr:hypothetical protein [Stutzerimonas nitrititolerans]